jgi:hypothetical protein
VSRNTPFTSPGFRWLWAAAGLVLSLAAGHAAPPSGTNQLPTARVVIAEDPAATEFFQPRADRVRTMVARGITNLTGQATAKAAWRSLVSPQDVVGLKVYSAAGPLAGTRVALVAAVVEGLIEAGQSPTNIVVWDKRYDDLQEAGYGHLATSYGVRVESSTGAGFDMGTFYENSLLGNLIFSDAEFGQKTGRLTGRKSFVSKLLTRDLTKIINLSPLLNNELAGVTGHLYSLALGSVDNTLRFEMGGHRMSVVVPEIYGLPALYDHVVLNITDALICQFVGSKSAMLHYAVPLNQLRFSYDPVALDVLSIRELQRQRQRAGISQPGANLDLYQNAALLELGVNDPARIQVETLR